MGRQTFRGCHVSSQHVSLLAVHTCGSLLYSAITHISKKKKMPVESITELAVTKCNPAAFLFQLWLQRESQLAWSSPFTQLRQSDLNFKKGNLSRSIYIMLNRLQKRSTCGEKPSLVYFPMYTYAVFFQDNFSLLLIYLVICFRNLLDSWSVRLFDKLAHKQMFSCVSYEWNISSLSLCTKKGLHHPHLKWWNKSIRIFNSLFFLARQVTDLTTNFLCEAQNRI